VLQALASLVSLALVTGCIDDSVEVPVPTLSCQITYPLGEPPTLTYPEAWTGVDDQGEPVVIMKAATYDALKVQIQRSTNYMRQAYELLVDAGAKLDCPTCQR